MCKLIFYSTVAFSLKLWCQSLLSLLLPLMMTQAAVDPGPAATTEVLTAARTMIPGQTANLVREQVAYPTLPVK